MLTLAENLKLSADPIHPVSRLRFAAMRISRRVIWSVAHATLPTGL